MKNRKYIRELIKLCTDQHSEIQHLTKRVEELEKSGYQMRASKVDDLTERVEKLEKAQHLIHLQPAPSRQPEFRPEQE